MVKISWKTLWTNGWFGGFCHPYFLVQHPYGCVSTLKYRKATYRHVSSSKVGRWVGVDFYGECMCLFHGNLSRLNTSTVCKNYSEIYWNCGLSNQKAVMLTRSTLRFGLRFVIHLNHELLGFENQKRTDSIYVSHSQNLWQCKIDPLCKLHIPFKEGILGCQSEIPRYPMWVCRDASQNYGVTLPETNSSPLKIGHPKRKLVFQPTIFRCKLGVSKK